MIVIPVIDLLDGVVVRAYKGQRDLYKPISSPLCPDSNPHRVVEQLLSVSTSDILYIADLNSIQNNGNNLDVILALATQHPDREIWLDAGIPSSLASAANITRVIGSESCTSLDALQAALTSTNNAVLSLDFQDRHFLGPPEILQHPALWPDRIILMSLDAVGSGHGADFASLQAILTQVKGRNVYAAGGVRHLDDLMRLKELGCAGALIASALHDLTIDRASLIQL